MKAPKITATAFDEKTGPTLVLAGPGTGKTFQLAKRIQFLLAKDVDPSEITVITFTREAARSMQSKLAEKGKEEYVPREQRPKMICTMHSLGQQIINERPETVGLQKGFTVLEADETKNLLIQDAALIRQYSMGDAKTAAVDRRTANPEKSVTSQAILDQYETILRMSNVVDYDDQIGLALRILKSNAEILAKYSTIAKHLLVDEYQDINHDQSELISLLTSKNREGLFVVGDDDQSIYTFRGTTPEFIRNFDKQYSEAATILQLQKSWRCKKSILLSAIAMISTHDPGRLPKVAPEFAIVDDDGEVTIHDCPTGEKEATIIAAIIKSEIQNAGNKKYSAYILVPSRLYAIQIERELQRFKIKYDFAGTSSEAFSKFMRMREWLENPDANLACRVAAQFVLENLSFPKGKIKVGRLGAHAMLAELWKGVGKGGKSLWDLLSSEDSEPLQRIAQEMKALQVAYQQGLPDFLKAMAASVRPWSTMDAFYKEISEQMAPTPGEPGCYEVRILSLQKSKGLEANSVFIVGLEDGMMPRSTASSDETAESARLLFVGMTRAKDRLHLMHASTRSGATTFAQKSHQMKPSRFLKSLPHAKKQYHERKA
jgi:superfamily I DNA/RNA helicase